MDEAGGHPSRAHRRAAPATRSSRPATGSAVARRRRASSGAIEWSTRRAQRLGLAEGGEALEAAEADVAVAEPDQHRRARRRGLVAAHQRLAGLDQREGLRGVDAQRLQHLGRQHLAHAALQRQPPVAAARPGRLARALGAEIEQAAVRAVAQLGEQEAAAVAEVGVVDAELVAVVAQRQRLGEVAGQRLEAAEMARSTRRRSGRPSPTSRGPAIVAEAQDRLREVGRAHRVVEGRAEGGVDLFGTEALLQP